MPAYALRAEFEDTFAGATLSAGPNGESLDTAAALKDGNGVIRVADTDSYAITALDEHPHFKRVSESKAEDVPVTDRFGDMTASQLRDEATRLGVENPGRSKDELLASVRASANPDAQEA